MSAIPATATTTSRMSWASATRPSPSTLAAAVTWQRRGVQGAGGEAVFADAPQAMVISPGDLNVSVRLGELPGS